MTQATDALRVELLAHCAQQIAHAIDFQQWIEDFTIGQGPVTLDEAYIVQDMVAKLRDDVPQGWKLGATSVPAQRAFGVSAPFVGRVFARDIYSSPAVISKVRADMLVVEGEFVFKMRESLPTRQSEYSLDEVVAAIDSLHPAIEYVQSRYRHRGKLNAIRSVADNAGQGALVIGKPIQDWHQLSLAQQTVKISVGGVVIATGDGSQVLGDPLTCMAWLANFLRERGHGLRAGEYITTGTCTGANEVPANTDVIADFGNLGKAQARFSV